MHEVTIPLRNTGRAEAGGNPEDYLKIIQDEYASRYLDILGIASTSANKAAVMRCRPMDDCEVHGVWAEGEPKPMADAIKIVPPLRQRVADPDFEDSGDVDQALVHHWYGQADRICVLPPRTPGRTVFMDDEDSGGGRGMGGGAGGVGGSSSGVAAAQEVAGAAAAVGAAAASLPPVKGSEAGGGLAAEMQRMRNDLQRLRQGGGRDAPGRPAGGGGGPKIGDKIAANADRDRHEHLKDTLATLKAKFILPFACEQPIQLGGTRLELRPWPAEGSLDLEVPDTLRAEVIKPIGMEMEDLRKSLTNWVCESMPLELLTSRRNEDQLLADVRELLAEPEVSHLAGLLAHLLYWLALGCNRRAGETKISGKALRALCATVHGHWAHLEGFYRDSPLGVNLVLPCLMLTLKYSLERCFEVQYPDFMADERLHQKLVDRINTLLMRLFDPDNMYARFGKFDGTGKGISLQRKLDLMASAQGHCRVQRLHGRMNRATPLVRSLVTQGFEADPAYHAGDAATRAMLSRGGLGGPAHMGSLAAPPAEEEWRTNLLRAAMARLAIPQEQTDEASSSEVKMATFRKNLILTGLAIGAPGQEHTTALHSVRSKPKLVRKAPQSAR
mmetsp:Transcript_96552/g.216212  ORF Transcript_96552/g.216212 Transcript_96552/m.216212 type:complete len:614 (-) Transcript_96552:60-1901(-)